MFYEEEVKLEEKLKEIEKKQHDPDYDPRREAKERIKNADLYGEGKSSASISM
jgi:hypothetical protein